MFRKSKREKEKRTSSFLTSSDNEDNVGNTNSLKRHSKLFSFGKKDKKKSHDASNGGLESPEGQQPVISDNNRDHGLSTGEKNAPHHMKTLHEENYKYLKQPDQAGSNNIFYNKEKNTQSSLPSRGSSSTFDFGFDTSLAFQNFTADVLRATEEKLKDVDLKLPEIKRLRSVDSSRLITVQRSPAGDFGIALRRSTMSKKENKIIHMVEPSNKEVTFGLLPGDKLVEVNGENVETLSREDIIEKVAASGNTVSLKVVPVPEFAELSSRTAAVQAISPQNRSPSLARSSSFMRKKLNKPLITQKIEENVKVEDQWSNAEKVWFVHSKGFSSALAKRERNDNDNDKVKVKLDHGGEILEVDDEAVEKMNPAKFDRAEDLSTLRYLNISGCLHTLRQRYAGNLIHTYAGQQVLIIKPAHSLGIYTKQVKEMFQGCKQEDMPPHIFSVAQSAYRSMMANHRVQSVVLRGNVGSGKTFNTKQVISYFSTLLSAKDNKGTDSKINAAFGLLESFTQTFTNFSLTASQATMFYTLNFDKSGFLVGLNIDHYCFNKQKVVMQPSVHESVYKIFYEFYFGCDEKTKEEYHLNSLSKEDNLIVEFQTKFESLEYYEERWTLLQQAFDNLSISSGDRKGILAPLAAILFLSAAGVTIGASNKPYFSIPIHAQKAASLLGTTEDILAKIIFSSSYTKGRSRSNSVVSRSNSVSSQTSFSSKTHDTSLSPSVSSNISSDNLINSNIAALQGFCIGLYIESFTALLRLINQNLNATSKVSYMLNVLDGPGFQNFSNTKQQSRFLDLCINYCYEKIQWLQFYYNFTSRIDRYQRENIDFNFDTSESISPDQTVITFDKITSDRRSSLSDVSDGKGLLWIVEDEALKPNSNELVLVDKIRGYHHPINKEHPVVHFDDNFPDSFIITHQQNSVPVKYNTNNWLKNVREHPTIKAAFSVLTDSKKSYISELYCGHPSGTYIEQATAASSRNRRKKTVSNLLTSKKNTITMQLKVQMDQLLESIENTQIHFVFCMLPRPLENNSKEVTDSHEFDIPYVAQQLKGADIIAGMRMHRQGYPDFMSFSEFLRRFDILVPNEEKSTEVVLDEKQGAGKMAQALELEERSYKLGLSNIFFRAGVLAQLEDTRDDKLSQVIIEFQAYCRGYLSRKHIKQKEFQLAAITCIQRNVRNYMRVHSWSWWRLYTKVLPLLDVHKTERELEKQKDETSSLKQKVDKLTKENQEYGEENSRLKKKIQELSHQLGEIHSSVAGTNDILAEETAERERLEIDLERAKEETESLLRQRNMLESELSELKLTLANGTHHRLHSLEDDVDDYDEEEAEEMLKNDTLWRNKYMEKSRELEKTRRVMSDQAEEEIQELMNQKRMADKALSEERSESDEVRRQLTNSKRKCAKLQGELDDMKLLLEGLQSRNSELEKKQRKFDNEMTNLRDELDQEITSRENTERERDKYHSEKNTLQNRINGLEDELSQSKRKVERLNQEIDEAVSSENSGAEITSLKRQIRELESKIQDQEEELDEQAGQIQQLEQAKLKVDMASQRDKQQFQRDIEAKDEEIEQIKIDHTRKLRVLEEQIEDEVHKREEANKVKRDLERKIFDLENSVENVDKGNERKLKKALKKYKMLYKDAKSALANQDSKQGDNALVKALRVQLEDADFSRHMAIKSKQQIEADMEELHKQIDNLAMGKETADEKCLGLTRDNGELLGRIDELEDEIEETIRKNKQQVTQLSELDMQLVDMREKYRLLEQTNDTLEEKVKSLTNKISNNEKNLVDRLELERTEAKIRELESRLESEGQVRLKLEHQVSRFRDQLERLQDEKTTVENNYSRLQQNISRTERQVKEVRAELESVQRQEAESKRRRDEAENRLLLMEDEISKKKNDLTNAEKRIRDLQESIENDMNASTDDDDTFSDNIDESDDSMTSFTRRPSLRRRQYSRKLSSESFENPMSSYTRLRRSLTSDDTYPSTNGYMSRDSSRYVSRTTSRRISRQGSRQEPNYD